MSRKWRTNTNSRGHEVTCCEGKHVSLSELKLDPQLDNHYLRKRNVPLYPENVVFHAPNVMHVTGESGLQGIFRDGGFRVVHYERKNSFLYFNLSVTEDEIAEAEYTFLQEIFPYGWNQKKSFLKEFTTSPAFQSESRYGNFRFTFTLKELLHRYACQFCHGTAPVFRVLDTKIYRQEIMYCVLVHPRHIVRYNHHRRLPRDDDDVCGYFKGQMSWCCQAPSGAYGHEFTVDQKRCAVKVQRRSDKEYYVWDHVTVAFHMEPKWVLRVNRERMYNSLTVCKVTSPKLLRDPDVALSEDKAEKILEDLGRKYNLVDY